jgi:hypothetical protein
MTRKSKRELERQVDALDPVAVGDVPQAGLCTLFGAQWEVVDQERRLIRLDDGEYRYVSPGPLEETFLDPDFGGIDRDTKK